MYLSQYCKIHRYPDGQVSVEASKELHTNAKLLHRCTSYEDLFILAGFADSYSAQFPNAPLPVVQLQGLIGGRADQRFGGQSLDLKLIADVINRCKYPRVEILSPHSPVALALIDNSVAFEPLEEIEASYLNMQAHFGREPIIVSPDAGAYKKLCKLCEDKNWELVASNKCRKGSEMVTQLAGNVHDKSCLIIDDLADGGYTFELLAQTLKSAGAHSVGLYVTHGYFHKGVDNLPTVDKIYMYHSPSGVIKGGYDEKTVCFHNTCPRK